MNSLTRLALAGGLALCTLAPAHAQANPANYDRDLTRVVRKYDGAYNVPESSVAYLARYYGRSTEDILDDLYEAEAELYAPPEPEPEPEPATEPEPEPDPAPEPSYQREVTPSSGMSSAPASSAREEIENEHRARIARIRAVFRAVDEDTGGEGASWKFHEYTDRETKAYFDDLHVVDVDEDSRLELSGRNLGRDDLNFRASFKGEKAKVEVQHDGIPHMFVKDGRSIFTGVGTTSLSVDPNAMNAGSRAARYTAWTREINQQPEIDVGILRERTHMNFDLYGDESNTKFKVTRDRRKGTRVGQASDPGHDTRYEIPIPVDYETIDYNLTTERMNGNLWWRAGLLLSHFNNGNDTMTFQNASGSVDTVSGLPATSLLDLAPENQRFLFSLAGSIRDLAKNGRINFTFAKGKMEQDDDLVPFSQDLGSINTPLPQLTANQEVETTRWRADYSMRPNRRSRFKLGYHGYKYEDVGSQIAFGGTAGEDGTFAADASGARTTEHLSWENKTLDLSYGYDFNSKTTGQIRFSRKDIERENREVADAQEDILKLIVDSRPTDQWMLRLSLENADRDHDGYDFLAPFRHFGNLTPNNNTPFTRKYSQASRERDALQLSATYMPEPAVAVTFTGMTAKNDYDEANTLGLKEEEEDLYGVDIDYRPIGKRFGLNVFANYETRDSRLDAREWRSGWTGDPYNDPGASTAALIASDWSLDQSDDVETYGVRFDWEFEPRKLSAQVGWVRSEHDGNFAFASPNSGVAAAALPGGASTGVTGPDHNNYDPAAITNVSDMVTDTLDLRFDVNLRKHRSLALGLRHERFDWKDYAVIGWTPVGQDGANQERDQIFLDSRPKGYDNTTVWFSYGVQF